MVWRCDDIGRGAVLLVNVCYPEWTGGWSTGPRLLVPLLPFAVLPIAGLIAGDSTFSRVATWLALVLAVAGGVEMLLVSGRRRSDSAGYRQPARRGRLADLVG